MHLQTIRITRDFKDLNKVCQLAKTAFPPEEYLSPDIMIAMQEEGNFDFFALYDEDTFVGYISMKLYKQFTYLFFFAIEEEYRDRGYGSEALRFLKENYKG